MMAMKYVKSGLLPRVDDPILNRALEQIDEELNKIARVFIDWTGDAGANNIHDDNILASSITQHEGDIDHDALTNYESDEHLPALDEDDLTSNSDTNVATQQSIKAYVDSLIAGVNEFIELTDTPANYTDSAGKFVKVNATPDALEFADIAWGDVSKVGSNLTDLATRQHAGLTDIGVDDHHNQDHATEHEVGGGDLVSHDSLTGFVAGEHFLQSAITTVGTIGTGVWQGTAIANTYIAGINQNLLTTSNVEFNDLITRGNVYIDTDTGAKKFYVTRLGAADQFLAIYVDDSYVHFVSAQDETTGVGGSFIFNMDNDGTSTPFFQIKLKSGAQVFKVTNTGATTLGTVETGVWQGTAIANAYIAGINQNLLTTSSPTFDNVLISSGDDDGIKFWASNSYKIYMRQDYGTEHYISDYNMYFTMTSGTNRGFVFMSGTTPKFQIDAAGNIWANNNAVIDGDLTVSGASTNFRNAIKAVDGSGSGIDADLLEGKHASSSAGNNTIVLRTASGYIYCNYLNCTSGATTSEPTHYFVETENDSFLRQMTPANFVAQLAADGLVASGSSPSFQHLTLTNAASVLQGGTKLNIEAGASGVCSLTIYGDTTASAGNMRVFGAPDNVIKRYSSARKYKDKIEDLELDSSLIYNLRPVSFNSKCAGDGDGRFHGLVADEVEEVIPEIIDYNSKGEVEVYDSQMLMTLMLAEIQRLNQRVSLLEN